MSRGLISFTFGFVGNPASVVKLRGKRKKIQIVGSFKWHIYNM